MAGEDILEEVEAFGDAVEVAVGAVVVGVEGLPVVEAVGEVVVPHAEVGLVDVEAGDAQRRLPDGAFRFFQFDVPVGLAEQVVGFFDALVEAEQHGPEAAVVGAHLILYKGVAVVEAAGFVVVVVKPVVLEADFGGDGAPESGQFPGLERRVESDGEGSELVHYGSGVCFVKIWCSGCPSALVPGRGPR